MNREGAKDAKEEKEEEEEEEEDAVLTSRSLCLRGLIIPMQPDLS
ncbi:MULTISPECIES: hypothetical protein [Microcoleus]|uniref:Anacyclamide n=1 Tax=Microcoleus anatoxicus PTRS2 TaxID=2705321 RepID=A0ABU8YI26_9CYAN